MKGVESVSALMDGELDAAEAVREIARFKQGGAQGAAQDEAQNEARHDAWNTYHAIGDVMRGAHVLAAGLSADSGFLQRLSAKLALEPTVLAPRLRLPAAATTAKTIQTYALSAAASVAAVAVVGWVAFNMLAPDVGPGTLARAPVAKPAAVALQSPPVVPLAPQAPVEAVAAVTPEHVHEYLLAHQGISPITAIQGVTPYIRTVSSAGDASGLR